MVFLTQREHGAAELLKKLRIKGYDTAGCQEALSECQRLGLQCDYRFSASLSRTRVQQGYGPMRIKQELNAKGVDEEIITQTLKELAFDWPEIAKGVWEKKFSKHKSVVHKELQKQQRFLLYRGFPQSIIIQLMKNTMMCEE